MKIKASASMANVTPSVTVEHNDVVLTFSISLSVYRRAIFNDPNLDIFSHINAYWAEKPPEVQQAIFDIYRRVFQAFDEVYTKEGFREFLQSQIKELFSYHDLDEVQRWVSFRGNIEIPRTIPQEFVVDVDRNTSIGKTYIAADYRRLVTLAMVLRCMVPIWAEYIHSIKGETDDNFKEMQAFQLVDKVLTPEVPAIKKLIEYIENTIASANLSRPMGVFRGISTSDYPRWLLALVCIRCLSVGDIRGNNPDAHLVTFTHMFIQGRISSKDEMGGGDSKVKDKEIDETMGEDGARASALERYKIKANISTGETVEFEHFLTNAVRVARELAPGIETKDILAGIEHMKDYEGRPTVPQVTLMQLVFKPVTSPKSILYLTEPQVKELMGVMEAVLWHRGHRYLAVLSTCYSLTSSGAMVVSPMDSKMRIPDELIEQLDIYFPYKRNQKNKKVKSKETNLAMESIDELTNNFTTYGWKPTSEKTRVKEVLGYESNRFLIKPDIKTEIARLVLEVQTAPSRRSKVPLMLPEQYTEKHIAAVTNGVAGYQ